MRRRILQACAGVVVAISVSACEMTKSEHPLGPTVAGPIPGVNITPPTPVEPGQGFRIAVDSQPVTLTLSNAATTGVRPLNYLFEVATDAGFRQQGIQPRRHRAGCERPHDDETAERARARALLLLARARPRWGEHRTVLVGGVLQRVHPGGARQADPAGAGRERYRCDAAARFPVCERAAQRTGRIGNLRDSVGRQRGLRERRRLLDGRRGGGPDFPPVSRSPHIRQTVFLARSWFGGDNDRSLVRGCGVQGAHVRCRRWRWWSGPRTGHVPPGPATAQRAEQVVLGVGTEFPSITAQGGSEAAGLQLMLRMIWHLKLAGFQAGRQQNPSGRVSEDKLTVLVDGMWRVYDVVSTRHDGSPLDVHFDEVPLPNHVPDPGVPD